MQKLPLRLLEPGMVIARAVVNEKGIALVAAGTELSEKLIARLENMGVSKVMVKGCPVKLDGCTIKTLQERLADLEIGFSQVKEENLLMKKFKVLLKAHFINRDREMKSGVEVPAAEPASQNDSVN